MEKRLMQYARERTLPLSDLSGDYTFSAQLIPDSSLSLSLCLSVCLSICWGFYTFLHIYKSARPADNITGEPFVLSSSTLLLRM